MIRRSWGYLVIAVSCITLAAEVHGSPKSHTLVLGAANRDFGLQRDTEGGCGMRSAGDYVSPGGQGCDKLRFRSRFGRAG